MYVIVYSVAQLTGHVLLELVELRRTQLLPVEQGHHAAEEQFSNR